MCRVVSLQREAVSDRLTDIEPQEEKHAKEGHASHSPFDGKQRPENARIVELPHPQPLLQQLRDRQQADQQSRTHHRCHNILLQRNLAGRGIDDGRLRRVEAVLVESASGILGPVANFENSDSRFVVGHDLIPFSVQVNESEILARPEQASLLLQDRCVRVQGLGGLPKFLQGFSGWLGDSACTTSFLAPLTFFAATSCWALEM